jgi:predicted RNA polymerase sigma factor
LFGRLRERSVGHHRLPSRTRTAAGDLDNDHLLHAAPADLLRRIGSTAEASKSYTPAFALVTNGSERRFLEWRLREVRPPEV